jgi:hypothetical protein
MHQATQKVSHNNNLWHCNARAPLDLFDCQVFKNDLVQGHQADDGLPAQSTINMHLLLNSALMAEWVH